MEIVLTAKEAQELKQVLIAWIGEGFTTPPYKPAIYALLRKVGIKQEDVQYDIKEPVR